MDVEPKSNMLGGKKFSIKTEVPGLSIKDIWKEGKDASSPPFGSSKVSAIILLFAILFVIVLFFYNLVRLIIWSIIKTCDFGVNIYYKWKSKGDSSYWNY
jgi:hypothetical protein